MARETITLSKRAWDTIRADHQRLAKLVYELQSEIRQGRQPQYRPEFVLGKNISGTDCGVGECRWLYNNSAAWAPPGTGSSIPLAPGHNDIVFNAAFTGPPSGSESPLVTNLGVAVEPVPNNKFGRFVISGMVWAKIRFPSTNAGTFQQDVLRFADIEKNNGVLLAKPEAGTARIVFWHPLTKTLALVRLSNPRDQRGVHTRWWTSADFCPPYDWTALGAEAIVQYYADPAWTEADMDAFRHATAKELKFTNPFGLAALANSDFATAWSPELKKNTIIQVEHVTQKLVTDVRINLPGGPGGPHQLEIKTRECQVVTCKPESGWTYVGDV